MTDLVTSNERYERVVSKFNECRAKYQTYKWDYSKKDIHDFEVIENNIRNDCIMQDGVSAIFVVASGLIAWAVFVSFVTKKYKEAFITAIIFIFAAGGTALFLTANIYMWVEFYDTASDWITNFNKFLEDDNAKRNLKKCQDKITADEKYFPIRNKDGSYNNSEWNIKKQHFDELWPIQADEKYEYYMDYNNQPESLAADKEAEKYHVSLANAQGEFEVFGYQGHKYYIFVTLWIVATIIMIAADLMLIFSDKYVTGDTLFRDWSRKELERALWVCQRVITPLTVLVAVGAGLIAAWRFGLIG